jgi:hypothetical protein
MTPVVSDDVMNEHLRKINNLTALPVFCLTIQNSSDQYCQEAFKALNVLVLIPCGYCISFDPSLQAL